MKEYQKPEVELVRFTAEEDLLLGDLGGEMGAESGMEGWE